MPHPPSSCVLNARVSLDGQPLPSRFELLWARVRHEAAELAPPSCFPEVSPERRAYLSPRNSAHTPKRRLSH